MAKKCHLSMYAKRTLSLLCIYLELSRFDDPDYITFENISLVCSSLFRNQLSGKVCDITKHIHRG